MWLYVLLVVVAYSSDDTIPGYTFFNRASAESSAVVDDVVGRISVILRFLYGLRSLIIGGLDVVKVNTSVQDLLVVEGILRRDRGVEVVCSCSLSNCSMLVLGFSFKI